MIKRLQVRILVEAAERIFFSRVNFVCQLLFGVRSSPVVPQWHIKDPVILSKVQMAGYT